MEPPPSCKIKFAICLEESGNLLSIFYLKINKNIWITSKVKYSLLSVEDGISLT